MILEEKVKVCSICKNRKHNIKEGLVCGKTGAKPTFADECPDFDIDIAEQERLKKNAAEMAEADHRKSGAFGFYIGFIAAGAVAFIMTFLAYAPFTLADLLSLPFLFAIFYVYFSAYAIYAYIEKKSDAIFIAKYLSVILFLAGLPTLFTGNLTDIIFNLGVPVGFFLFLTYSKEINKRMPKEERKLTKLNKIMVILSIIVQVFLYIGDFMGTELNAATVRDSDEKTLIKACQEQRKELPRNINDGFYWEDMILSGDAVEFKYVYNDGMTPELGEFAELINKYRSEIAKEATWAVRNQDQLINILANTDKYGIRYKYFSPDGKLVLDLLVPNSEIKRMMSQDGYTTRRSDFISILESYNKIIHLIEFFDGCRLCKCSLSKDGKTLHYDLKLYGGDTAESLAELTPEHMRGQIMQVILPNMLGDFVVDLAIRNQMSISFNHTSEDVSSWSLNVLIEPHEYNQLLNQ